MNIFLHSKCSPSFRTVTLTFFFCSPQVDIKYIGGADPEMVLLDADSNEVEVHCGI